MLTYLTLSTTISTVYWQIVIPHATLGFTAFSRHIPCTYRYNMIEYVETQWFLGILHRCQNQQQEVLYCTVAILILLLTYIIF